MHLRLDRLRYHSYLIRRKLKQFPDVVRERTPQILQDVTCRAPVGDVYAVVVKYVRFGLEPDFLALLDSLAAAAVNTVVVCNGTPTEEMLALLRPRVQRILVRPNVGRDFGGYRAATLHFLKEGRSISRLIYLNDSQIFIPGPELDALVTHLARSDYDVVGATENHAVGHHLGSFALSVSSRVLADPKVRAFWQRYKPYDIRPLVIRRGELRLTTLLKRRGFSMDVIYRADHLATRLSTMSFAELIGLLRYMPRQFQAMEMTPALSSIATLAYQFAPDPEAAAAGPAKDPAIPRRFFTGAANGPEDELVKTALIDLIMRTVADNSQIHYGFGLLHKILGCPLVKKDLLQRDIFTERQITQILDDLPGPQRDRIVRELTNRGRPTFMTKKQQFLLRHGFV